MIDLRDATDAHIPAILEIYNHEIATSTGVFQYTPHTLDMRRAWVRDKQAHGFPVIVAVEDGTVLGFAAYGPFRTAPAYRYTVEHSVFVAAAARRRGIARTLIEALVARARAQGMHVMLGGVVSENAASVRLHEALGFVEVAYFRQVGFKFGRWLDLKFFQLTLDTPPHPVEG